MITTLLAACAKQKEGIPFGPADIKGSVTSLITRGLIVREVVITNNGTKTLWQVTENAISILRAMGVEVAC